LLSPDRAVSGHPDAPAAVRLTGVSRTFGERAVLDRLNLAIRPAEFVAILGASGAGKTTLLRLLAGLDQVDGGTIIVPAVRSVVFQEPRLVPAKRAWQNVVLGRRGKAARDEAHSALAEVGLSAHVDTWPLTLSGGEAQRVALARALVREPGLLLLDEPFAALDALTRLRMHDLVLHLWQRHRPAVVLVTHDVDEAVLLADRVLVLSNGAFTLDLPVKMAKPRERTNQHFASLRARLLAELGVGTQVPPH
jgi:sulfonate transport system ATP-binding protein